MTERFYPPVFKFTTATLKTLPFAQLIFSIAGTTTPKTVYKDANKAVAWGNIVPADADGNFPPIFLDGTYLVTLKSSVASGSIVQDGWPVDNIGGEDTGSSFSQYNSSQTYSIGDLITDNMGLRYESLQNNNLNHTPGSSPTYWKRVYFGGVFQIASGAAVSYSGTADGIIVIPNTHTVSIQLSDEKFVGIMNIRSFINGGMASACFFVALDQPVPTKLSDAYDFYYAGSPTVGSKIGVTVTGPKNIFITNQTGYSITTNINIVGGQVTGITEGS